MISLLRLLRRLLAAAGALACAYVFLRCWRPASSSRLETRPRVLVERAELRQMLGLTAADRTPDATAAARLVNVAHEIINAEAERERRWLNLE